MHLLGKMLCIDVSPDIGKFAVWYCGQVPELDSQTVRPASSHVRLDIQGLRAFAVILVILFHLGLPVPGGFVGVDVFFVISGYVITAMLERELLSQGSIDVRRFFIRRFWRLTPALATVVAMSLLVGARVISAIAPKNSPQQIMVATGIGAMFLSANLVIAKLTGTYFDNSAETNVLLNTWSLSVEEQFYIGFLAILILGWFVGRLVKQERIVVVVGVSLVFCSSLWLAILAQPGGRLDTPNWLLHFYSPLNRAWEFAAGALVALLVKELSRLSSKVRETCALLGIFLILYSAFFISEGTVWPGSQTLIPVIGAVLFVAAPIGSESMLYRVSANKIAVYMGDRSYSLYLWHWPVIVLVGYLNLNSNLSLIIKIFVTILLSLLTFRFIETKFRHWNSKRRFKSVITGLIIFGFPIMSALLVSIGLKHDYWNANLAKQHSSLATNPIGATHSCSSPISFLRRSPANCTWNSDSKGLPVYLIGDSNAEQFSDAVVEATSETGNPLVIANRYGCPFLTPAYVQPDRSSTMSRTDLACSSFFMETHRWLKTQKRGLVVISNTESYATVPRRRTVALEQADLTTKKQYFELLEQTVKDLEADGFKVAIIVGPPHFNAENPKFPKKYEWNPAKCNLKSIFDSRCKSEMPIGLVDRYQNDYIDSIRELAQRTHAEIIDLSRALCKPDYCATQADGVQIYRDGSHLTVSGDLLLVPTFINEIRRITFHR